MLIVISVAFLIDTWPSEFACDTHKTHIIYRINAFHSVPLTPLLFKYSYIYARHEKGLQRHIPELNNRKRVSNPHSHTAKTGYIRSKSSKFSRYCIIFRLILLESTHVTKSSMFLVTRYAGSVTTSDPTRTWPCSMNVTAYPSTNESATNCSASQAISRK